MLCLEVFPAHGPAPFIIGRGTGTLANGCFLLMGALVLLVLLRTVPGHRHLCLREGSLLFSAPVCFRTLLKIWKKNSDFVCQWIIHFSLENGDSSVHSKLSKHAALLVPVYFLSILYKFTKTLTVEVLNWQLLLNQVKNTCMHLSRLLIKPQGSNGVGYQIHSGRRFLNILGSSNAMDLNCFTKNVFSKIKSVWNWEN